MGKKGAGEAGVWGARCRGLGRAVQQKTKSSKTAQRAVEGGGW